MAVVGVVAGAALSKHDVSQHLLSFLQRIRSELRGPAAVCLGERSASWGALGRVFQVLRPGLHLQPGEVSLSSIANSYPNPGIRIRLDLKLFAKSGDP